MTPRELGAALGRRPASVPNRAALARLMTQWPDEMSATDQTTKERGDGHDGE